ncbi:MAG: hypothetical protein AAGF94_17420 [Pseudomonadota bacterium]
MTVFCSLGEAQSTLPRELPPDAVRLTTVEIKALLGTGALFDFVGAGGRAVGTSTWNINTKTASGLYVWDNKIQGTWNLNWKVEDDKSCLENGPNTWECELIYAYNDGFLEVDDTGAIHTLTTPRKAAALGAPLTASEAAASLPPFFKWAQKLTLDVLSSTAQDGVITVKLEEATTGRVMEFRIDAATGSLLSSD